MKYGLLSVLFASALVTSGWAQEVGKPTIVPVTKAAFHQFSFQDGNMSLENLTLPPGLSTGYHSHDQDVVFVITAGAKIKGQVLGKDPAELEFKLGEVGFVYYTKSPGVHQVINLEKENALRLLAVGSVILNQGVTLCRCDPRT